MKGRRESKKAKKIAIVENKRALGPSHLNTYGNLTLRPRGKRGEWITRHAKSTTMRKKKKKRQDSTAGALPEEAVWQASQDEGPKGEKSLVMEYKKKVRSTERG